MANPFAILIDGRRPLAERDVSRSPVLANAHAFSQGGTQYVGTADIALPFTAACFEAWQTGTARQTPTALLDAMKVCPHRHAQIVSISRALVFD